MFVADRCKNEAEERAGAQDADVVGGRELAEFERLLAVVCAR